MVNVLTRCIINNKVNTANSRTVAYSVKEATSSFLPSLFLNQIFPRVSDGTIKKKKCLNVLKVKYSKLYFLSLNYHKLNHCLVSFYKDKIKKKKL